MRFIVTTTVLSAWCTQVQSSSSASAATASSPSLFTEDEKRTLLDAVSTSKIVHLGRNKRKVVHKEERKIGGRTGRRRANIIEDDEALLLKNNIRGGAGGEGGGYDRQNQQQLRRQEKDKTVSSSKEEVNDVKDVMNVVECDPKEEAADSGILTSTTCDRDAGYYCMESRISSLGGICVQNEQTIQRNLPEFSRVPCTFRDAHLCPHDTYCDYQDGWSLGGYCELCPCQDPADPTYNMCNFLAANGILSNSAGFFSCAAECHHNVNDCQEWTQTSLDYCVYDAGFDQYTKTGSVTCSSDEYCSYGCCYTIAYSENFLNGYVESNAMTYSFSSPYSQDITISYNPYEAGSLAALAGDECTIEINGNECDSCWKTGHCIEFDCTNIPGDIGASGHTCDDGGLHDLIPIYQQCFFEGHGCNICGTDTGLSLINPDAKSVVPGFNGIEYYCDEIYDAGLHRLFDDNGSEICNTVSPVVRPICCGNPNTNVGNNGPPNTGNTGNAICNICQRKFGPGSQLNSPHASVPFVGQNCQHYYFQGLLGQIHPGNCQSVSDNVAPHCCSQP